MKSCRVLFDHNGVSKQVAFVQFDTNQQALDSIAALHNKEVRPIAQPQINSLERAVCGTLTNLLIALNLTAPQK